MRKEGIVAGIVVDMQNKWIWSYKDKERLRRNVYNFVEGMVASGIPYWVIENGAYGETKNCVYGIKIPDGHLVKKSEPSCFRFTDLEERLLSFGISEIILCGVCLENCLLETFMDGAGKFGLGVALDSSAKVMRGRFGDWRNRYEEMEVLMFPGYKDALNYAVSVNKAA